MSSISSVKPKILLVEDEESLAIGIEYNLAEEGYSVVIAGDGKKALEFYEKGIYDLIILDIMLPYYNGFELAEIIRKQEPRIPLLVLTAKSKDEDKIKGLSLGVDDYITKPFHMQELLLRIKGMLKRKSWYDSSFGELTTYSFGGNEINFENFNCRRAGEQFQLTQNEIMVLRYLIYKKGRVVTRKDLLENVWNVNPDIETRTVDIFISRLRKYFEKDPSDPQFIKSVRGAGYIFED